MIKADDDIKSPSTENLASKAIDDQIDTLAKKILNEIYEEGGYWNKFGDVGKQRCLEDINFTLEFLSKALATGSKALFKDYALWSKIFFSQFNIQMNHIVNSYELTKKHIAQITSSEEVKNIVFEYMDVAIKVLKSEGTIKTNTYITDDNKHHDLVRGYIQALLQGERHIASKMIIKAVENGVPVKEIYLHVFQPAQREIGRLWQTNQITVAQEHYCTAATQLIMSGLYPYIFSTAKHGKKVVAACVGNELHEIGIRMVADFLEMDGWDTYYLGANTPKSSIIATLHEQEPDLLALSTTMTSNLAQLKDIISTVKQHKELEVKILVGGYPFIVDPNLWKKIGADACAKNAEEAVKVVRDLVNFNN